jgi:CRP-like cAMP-binding protein
MPHKRAGRDNGLLASLSPIDYERVAPHLQPCVLRQGFAFNASAAFDGHLCFATSGIVATSSLLRNGDTMMLALAGREGVVGIPLLLAATGAHDRATVLSAGLGWRLDVDLVRDPRQGLAGLRRVLLAYTQALIEQVAQGAACNRYHSLEQRLCRCILECMDRLPGDDIAVTHQSFAHLLGARRESVTAALGRLDEGGLVRCGRGHVAVQDRPGMEARACECYRAVREAYRRLLQPHAAEHAQRLLVA